MEYLKDLLEFLSTVINSWAGYATGGVAVALLWLWSTHKQRPIPKKIAMTAATLFLFLAFFTSWRAQKNLRITAEAARAKAENERDQLVRDRTPDLVLSIDEIGAGTASIGKMSQTGVFITASLVNHGAPSIAEGWWLKATLTDGRSDQVPTLYLDPTKIMNGRDQAPGSPPWKLSQADALYVKASSKPIQQGDKIRGILVFLFKSFEPQDMKKKGTRYVLHCNDVDGKAVEANWTFRAMGDPHEYFPGLAPIPH